MSDNKKKQDNYLLLLNGCLNQKRESQYQLYKLLSSKMFGVCLRYATSYNEAEDILQEGFTKLFLNLEKYRGDGSFEGWARRIFVNTAIEQYRRNSKMFTVVEVEIAVHEETSDSIEIHLNQEDLLKLIQELSPGYRAIFNLYSIEGYSHREISEILNISEGTSKSQLSRARSILQKRIEEIDIKEKKSIG
jgi:RNA polymerase sigma-70 factor (ECF subfamily)